MHFFGIKKPHRVKATEETKDVGCLIKDSGQATKHTQTKPKDMVQKRLDQRGHTPDGESQSDSPNTTNT